MDSILSVHLFAKFFTHLISFSGCLWNAGWQLHSFSTAAVTSFHKPVAWTIQIYYPPVLEVQSVTSFSLGNNQLHSFLEALSENHFLAHSSYCNCWNEVLVVSLVADIWLRLPVCLGSWLPSPFLRLYSQQWCFGIPLTFWISPACLWFIPLSLSATFNMGSDDYTGLM